MADGIAITIGLNRIDPAFYAAFAPIDALSGCVNDARAIADLARGQGLDAWPPLLDDEATAANVRASLARAAEALGPGGLLVLHYSGHGADLGTETAGVPDTAWCLFDGPMLGHELFDLWFAFRPGVRILLLSDSCHSGAADRDATIRPHASPAGPPARPRPRALARRVIDAAASDNPGYFRGMYARASAVAEGRAGRSPAASVLLLSACAVDQTAADGDAHGLFTGALLDAWGDGASFQGNYLDLMDRVRADVSRESGGRQSPAIDDTVGDADSIDDFKLFRPFTV